MLASATLMLCVDLLAAPPAIGADTFACHEEKAVNAAERCNKIFSGGTSRKVPDYTYSNPFNSTSHRNRDDDWDDAEDYLDAYAWGPHPSWWWSRGQMRRHGNRLGQVTRFSGDGKSRFESARPGLGHLVPRRRFHGSR